MKKRLVTIKGKGNKKWEIFRETLHSYWIKRGKKACIVLKDMVIPIKGV